MNETDFYEKLLGEKWFKREVITSLLKDIGRKLVGEEWGDNVDITFDEDGIALDVEVYVPCMRGCCGEWEHQTEHIYWDVLVDRFFNEIERDNPESSNR